MIFTGDVSFVLMGLRGAKLVQENGEQDAGCLGLLGIK